MLNPMCPRAEGMTVHIQMLSARWTIDAWKERSNCKCTHTPTHTHTHVNTCSSGILAKYFKGPREKTKGKWISESGAAVPEETGKEPPSPSYNRNKIVWSPTLPLLLLSSVNFYPPNHTHCKHPRKLPRPTNTVCAYKQAEQICLQPAKYLIPPGTHV